MSMYCPNCGAAGPFTQEGLSAKRILAGYYRCLACMDLVIPVVGARKSTAGESQATTADQADPVESES